MKYRLPAIEDEQILNEYVKEHYDNGETEIHAGHGISEMSYSNWMEKIVDRMAGTDKTWGKSLVYLAFNDNNKLVGMISIRYELKDEMRMVYGDVGYGVRPTERRKGYATEMLKFAVNVCKERGMKDVILGCHKDNIASAKTIEKGGGIKVEEKEFEGKMACYYKIDIK